VLKSDGNCHTYRWYVKNRSKLSGTIITESQIILTAEMLKSVCYQYI